MHNVKIIITHRETKYSKSHDLREGRGGLSSVDVSPISAVVTVSFHGCGFRLEKVMLTRHATTCCVYFFPILAHLPAVILGVWPNPQFWLCFRRLWCNFNQYIIIYNIFTIKIVTPIIIIVTGNTVWRANLTASPNRLLSNLCAAHFKYFCFLW